MLADLNVHMDPVKFSKQHGASQMKEKDVGRLRDESHVTDRVSQRPL